MIKNLNQNGVAHMAVVIVILLVVTIGATGYVVWKNNSHNNASTNQTHKQGKYILSGFLSQNSYNARNPEWDGDKEYASYESALTVAKQWQDDNGDDSTVEIIELDGSNPANVRAVIDRNGIEKIQ